MYARSLVNSRYCVDKDDYIFDDESENWDDSRLYLYTSFDCVITTLTQFPNKMICWLIVWVLWYINLYRLFNAKSIFIPIISSISNNSV